MSYADEPSHNIIHTNPLVFRVSIRLLPCINPSGNTFQVIPMSSMSARMVGTLLVIGTVKNCVLGF